MKEKDDFDSDSDSSSYTPLDRKKDESGRNDEAGPTDAIKNQREEFLKSARMMQERLIEMGDKEERERHDKFFTDMGFPSLAQHERALMEQSLRLPQSLESKEELASIKIAK